MRSEKCVRSENQRNLHFDCFCEKKRQPFLSSKFSIETNNNILTVQSESSKFASLLFDHIPNRRVVGTDRNAICWYFTSITLCLALLFIISIAKKLVLSSQQHCIKGMRYAQIWYLGIGTSTSHQCDQQYRNNSNFLMGIKAHWKIYRNVYALCNNKIIIYCLGRQIRTSIPDILYILKITAVLYFRSKHFYCRCYWNAF